MSTQYAIPAVGSKVRITVRTKEIFIFANSEFRDTVFEGTVLAADKWVSPTSFCLTGNKDVRVREIPIHLVTGLEMLDGSAAEQVEVDSGIKTFQVSGSKGSIYTVTKIGNKVTCTCPGFQFRKACKHTALA